MSQLLLSLRDMPGPKIVIFYRSGLNLGEPTWQNFKLVTKCSLQSSVSPLSPISEIVGDNWDHPLCLRAFLCLGDAIVAGSSFCI